MDLNIDWVSVVLVVVHRQWGVRRKMMCLLFHHRASRASTTMLRSHPADVLSVVCPFLCGFLHFRFNLILSYRISHHLFMFTFLALSFSTSFSRFSFPFFFARMWKILCFSSCREYMKRVKNVNQYFVKNELSFAKHLTHVFTLPLRQNWNSNTCYHDDE